MKMHSVSDPTTIVQIHSVFEPTTHPVTNRSNPDYVFVVRELWAQASFGSGWGEDLVFFVRPPATFPTIIDVIFAGEKTAASARCTGIGVMASTTVCA